MPLQCTVTLSALALALHSSQFTPMRSSMGGFSCCMYSDTTSPHMTTVPVSSTVLTPALATPDLPENCASAGVQEMASAASSTVKPMSGLALVMILRSY